MSTTSEYTVQVGTAPTGAKRQVQIEPLDEAQGGAQGGASGAPERFRIVVDGRESIVSARRLEGSTYSILTADGSQHVIDVDGALPELRVTVAGGEPLRLQLQDARALALAEGAGAAGGAQGSGELRAAMPGKVVKVLCKRGDSIKAGQGLLVIEAMKMENELRATAAGQVTDVLVREGQTVEGGQILLTLAAP